MSKVTIKKEGAHFIVNVGGRGMTLANTKLEAQVKAKEFRKQQKRLKTLK